MALTRDCQNRLRQWKFGQAATKLEPGLATEDEDTLVRSLARVFGNVGAFEGDLSDIVQAAVSTLLTHPGSIDSSVPRAHP